MLGPLFFLIFVNNLNSLTKVLDPVLFADNTNLFCFCSNNNIRTLFKTTNLALSQINDLFLANILSLNVGKTKYMSFHKLSDQENIPLKLSSLQLNGSITQRENSLKFLGFILDEHLSWKKHIQLFKNKVSKILAFFIKQLN